MEEKKTAHAANRSDGIDQGNEELRVTDRRRINIDGDPINGDADDAAAGEPRPLPSFVEQLKASKEAAEQKLVEVQSRFEQLKSKLQQDVEETRQRLNRAADERAKREKADFIASLLPVIDNLYRALESSNSASFESLLEGIRGTANGFENALISAGVEPVQSVGAKFDPELHEAVDTIEVDSKLDGTVTSEYSRGYRIGDRLLRPARVQVGRAQTGKGHAK